MAQPLAQQPAAHGCFGAVKRRQQGQFLAFVPPRGEELQVAAGLGVQGHEAAGGVDGQVAQFQFGCLLSAGQILHDGPGGGHSQVHALAAKGLQREDAEVGQERLAGFAGMKGTGLHRRQFVARAAPIVRRVGPGRGIARIRHQYLRRLDAFQFQGQFVEG